MVHLYGEINRVGPRSGHLTARAHARPVLQLRAIFTVFRQTWMLYTYFDVSDSIYPVADQNKATSGWEFLS